MKLPPRDEIALDMDSKTLVEEVQAELKERRKFSIRASKRARNRNPLLRSLRALQTNSRLKFFDIMRLGNQLACIGLIEEAGDRRWNIEECDDELVIVVTITTASTG